LSAGARGLALPVSAASPATKAFGEIERHLRFRHRPAMDFILPLRRRQTTKIHSLQSDVHHRPVFVYHLNRFAVDHGESGSQGFVPPKDLPNPPFQRVDEQRAFNANRQRNIVERASGLELIQKPHPSLCERGWEDINILIRNIHIFTLQNFCQPLVSSLWKGKQKGQKEAKKGKKVEMEILGFFLPFLLIFALFASSSKKELIVLSSYPAYS